MDDRRARLEELRKRKRYAELKAKQGSVSRETSPSFGQQFVESFTKGSDIGENIAGGRFLAETGTKIGAGIAAALPPYDKPYAERYEEALAPSTAIRERERAADEASPFGSFVKGSLASLPMGGMAKVPVKAPLPTAETISAELASMPVAEQAAAQATKQATRSVQKMDPFTKKMQTVTEPVVPSAQPRSNIDPFTKKPMPQQQPSAMREVTETIAPEPFPQGTGNFTYPGDTAKEKLMEYFARQKGLNPEGPSTLQKAMPFIKEQAEELLPYPARAALRGYRRFKKGGVD